MTPKGYATTTGIIFSLVAPAHLMRVIAGWDFRVAGRDVPSWASVIAASRWQATGVTWGFGSPPAPHKRAGRIWARSFPIAACPSTPHRRRLSPAQGGTKNERPRPNPHTLTASHGQRWEAHMKAEFADHSTEAALREGRPQTRAQKKARKKRAMSAAARKQVLPQSTVGGPAVTRLRGRL